MADAMVERGLPTRFFCHRCHVEFQDVEQSYLCPYCEGGFIEQLEGDNPTVMLLARDYNDAAMSAMEDMNVDDMGMDESDELTNPSPMLNDLALLMSGARRHGINTTTIYTASPNETASNGTATTNSTANTVAPPDGNPPAAGATPGNANPPRGHTLMDELLWMIGGGRPPAGALTAGAPFVLVGTPGDYVFGGDGLDAVVTQLLGQLEHSGPPPLPRDRLGAIPTEEVTEEQAAANITCSVCWDNFQVGETTARLECQHVFHKTCITPWLELHATCPICRRSLLPPQEQAPPPPPERPNMPTIMVPTLVESQQMRLPPRIVIQRRMGPTIIRRIPSQTHTWDSLTNSSTSGSMSPASSVTTGGIWAPQTRSQTNSTGSTNSSTSLNSNDRDRQYNTDIDYD